MYSLGKITSIFRQAAFNRAFELKVSEKIEDGKIKIPTYLSLGTEFIPPAILSHYGSGNYVIFAQHRCHSWYLTAKGDPVALVKELYGRADGCNRGYGGSASISIPGVMFGHSGLLGDNAAIACGYAQANPNAIVICVLGDAAVEEDYVLGSLGYAATHKLNIKFIIEDNGLSISTPKHPRRSWEITNIAKGFGLWVEEIYDKVLCSNTCNVNLENALDYRGPSLINIHCRRHCWHAGVGCDGKPEWNTYEEVKKSFGNIINAAELEEVEKKRVERIFSEVDA